MWYIDHACTGRKDGCYFLHGLRVILKWELEVVWSWTTVNASWDESFAELVQKVGKEFALTIVKRIVITTLFSCSHVCVYFRERAMTNKSRNCSSAMHLLHIYVIFLHFVKNFLQKWRSSVKCENICFSLVLHNCSSWYAVFNMYERKILKWIRGKCSCFFFLACQPAYRGVM